MLYQTSPNRYDRTRPVGPLASSGRVSFNHWTMATHRILASVFILIWYAIGLRWIWLYRPANLFDWDEAEYLYIAAAAARTHEFGAWVQTVFLNYQAPATPGIASAIFSVFGIYPILGFLVPLSAAALTLFLVFSMGWRMGGQRMAWVALVLVATMPVFVDYSRHFYSPMGSTLATMAALYCLLRSDGMARFRWAVLFGACVGLMPLTRTMVFAYVPALIMAALISSLGRENSLQRIARLSGATILAAAITALWLVPNWKEVWAYLIGSGYGERSTQYGTKTSLLQWDAWDRTLRYYFEGTHLIHSAILLAGATVAAIFAVRRSRGLKPRQVLKKVAHSRLLGPVTLFAFGTVALASTPLKGTAFDLPLLSALTLISAWGLTRGHKDLQRSGVVAIVVAVLIVYFPDVDLRWPSAEYRAVDIPGIGGSIITDGRGTLQQYESAGIFLGGQKKWAADGPEPIDAATTREWQKIIAQTVEFIRRENESSTPVAFVFRHFLYNVNSIQLAQLSHYDHKINFHMIDKAAFLDKSEGAYYAWLTNEIAGGTCLLFTSPGIVNEFPPEIDSEAWTSAARHAGYVSFARWKLPDGRDVMAWRGDSDSCRRK
jgi:4-amino-4-deoxy-L-arabinose transferase-like glycosyltransferase